MTAEMRVLTVRNPWAGAIMHQGKLVENRSRNIAGDYRGPVAIHVAKRHDYSAVDALIERTGHIAPENIYGYGLIIGVVDLVDVHENTRCGIFAPLHDGESSVLQFCSPWADGARYHMVLANPRRLTVPIEWKGALGLRRLPAATVDLIMELQHG
jgi:hypothetical protein